MPLAQSQTLALDQLHPSERNPNRMDPAAYAQLVANIRAKGFLQPVLVRFLEFRGHPQEPHFEIIDGEHRWRAAGEVGLPGVPAIQVSCTADEAALLRISMNKLRGELDLAEVGSILDMLSESGFEIDDLLTSGFSTQEIGDLLDVARGPDEEELVRTTTAQVEQEVAAEQPAVAFRLEIDFASRAQFVAARKALKRAAGKGQPLAAGLLKVLALDEP